MDEAQWKLSNNPERMLISAKQRGCSARKLWLFACACGRMAWTELPVGLQEQIVFAEAHPEDRGMVHLLPEAAVEYGARFGRYSHFLHRDRAHGLSTVAIKTAFFLGPGQARAERIKKATLLRHILGIPSNFRRSSPPGQAPSATSPNPSISKIKPPSARCPTPSSTAA